MALSSVNGRYIEVRVGLIRDDPSKNPMLYELTLHGLSTSIMDWFLEDEVVQETQDAVFWPYIEAPEPLQYQWWARYPWGTEWTMLAGETNALLVIPNVDMWDDGTEVGVWVRNGAGQEVWLGPAELWVLPLAIELPDRRYGTSGKASRYPATIEVFGQPTNGPARVEVWLNGLTHSRPEDLDILMVSPRGHKIMLMSDAGGAFAVTNATLVFHPWPARPDNRDVDYPPETTAIPSIQRSDYWPRNYGVVESQLPDAPQGPYVDGLHDVLGTDPNGTWRLYLYDDSAVTGSVGRLNDSWQLRLFFE